VCVSACQHASLLNGLRYHHEIVTGARHGQKLGRLRKWLHSDTLHAGGDLPSLTLYTVCQKMTGRESRPAQAPARCTKCNVTAHPSTASVPITVLPMSVALRFSCAHKGLKFKIRETVLQLLASKQVVMGPWVYFIKSAMWERWISITGRSK